MAADKENDSTFFRQKGAIAWMAGHSVTANLLMAVLVVGGLVMSFRIKQEFLPEAQLEVVRVGVSYPGASPAEVEEGIILPIEEALEGIDGIEEITSKANEGNGAVMAEIADGEDLQEINTDIKNAISNPCNGGVLVVPGSTWYWQYWHRQPMGKPATFSAALAVTFD